LEKSTPQGVLFLCKPLKQNKKSSDKNKDTILKMYKVESGSQEMTGDVKCHRRRTCNYLGYL